MVEDVERYKPPHLETWVVEYTDHTLWVGTPKGTSKVDDVVVSLDYSDGYRQDYLDRQVQRAELIARAPALLRAVMALCRTFPESDDDNSIDSIWGRYGSELAMAVKAAREAMGPKDYA